MVVPVADEAGKLTLVAKDAFNSSAINELTFILKRDIEPMVVEQADLEKALSTYYGSTDEMVDSFMAEMTSGDVDITGVMSTMRSALSSFNCNFITSPHAGAPTIPVAIFGSFGSNRPTE